MNSGYLFFIERYCFDRPVILAVLSDVVQELVAVDLTASKKIPFLEIREKITALKWGKAMILIQLKL